MATWKKVIVSGSTANLAALQVDNLTLGQVVIGGGTGNLSTTAINGTGNIVATTGATVNMSGSFSGSFVGNGAGLTGVTATAVFPTTQVTNLVSQDKFFISQSTGQEFVTYGNLLNDLAGTNLVTESNDSLTLAAQISVTGVTASFLGNLTGTASFATYATNAGTAATSSFVLNAVSASYATFAATATSASFATNAATATSASFATQAANASNATTAVTSISASITDTTTGGIHFLVFTTGSTGNQSLRVDSNGPTVNVTQNSISASSFTGSLLGTATTASYVLNAVSASFATTAASATTASYVLNAVSASFATTAASATSASYATFAATATSASYATNASTATSASFASAVASIAANVTNNTDNRVLTATGGSTINGEGNLTFDGTTLTVTGNEVVTGNLTVQGTASFQNTTNLEVADRFVLFASGSNTAGDGGIVVQQGIQNVGELFGYENSVNRWGFTSSFNAGSPSYTAAAFVTTTETSISVPSAAPVYGGASNGYGNIHVNSSTGDIFIYA